MASKTQYGLKLKGKDRILGVRVESETSEFSNGKSYHLDEWEDEKWLVNDLDTVVMAKWTSEEWYNSSYNEPVNPYHPLELEIIKVATITLVKEITIEEEVERVNDNLKERGYATINIEEYRQN